MTTVAEALADLATGPGLGPTPFTEVAGPQEESPVEMATLLAARRGHPSKIEGVSDPADPDRELNENGGLLPGPGAANNLPVRRWRIPRESRLSAA